MNHSLVARPPLLNLETVCVVAREGSFSAAAAVGNVTHGAISRRIQAVENWLGVPLFERHGRGVRLTPDGQRFVGRIDQAFNIIDEAAEQWHPNGNARLVKMSVLPSFAKLWLFERLAALEVGPPDSRIQLDIEHRNADVTGGDVDVAIRYGRGTWANVDCEVFLPEMLYPVASRNIADTVEGAGSNALLLHPLLHDSDLTGWRVWFEKSGITFKRRPQDRRFEDYDLVLAAAEAGLGIALARSPFADDWLKRSKLVRLSRLEVPSPLAFYFVTAKRERRPEILTLVRKMKAAAQSTFPGESTKQ